MDSPLAHPDGHRHGAPALEGGVSSGPLSALDHFPALVGLRALDSRIGHATVGLRADERHTNAAGILHGGVLLTLIDAVVSVAAHARGEASVSINISANFVRSAKVGDELVARAQEQHAGSRLASYVVQVCCQDRLIATAIAETMVVEAATGRRASSRS